MDFIEVCRRRGMHLGPPLSEEDAIRTGMRNWWNRARRTRCLARLAYRDTLSVDALHAHVRAMVHVTLAFATRSPHVTAERPMLALALLPAHLWLIVVEALAPPAVVVRCPACLRAPPIGTTRLHAMYIHSTLQAAIRELNELMTVLGIRRRLVSVRTQRLHEAAAELLVVFGSAANAAILMRRLPVCLTHMTGTGM